jgi:hypothetical protein
MISVCLQKGKGRSNTAVENCAKGKGNSKALSSKEELKVPPFLKGGEMGKARTDLTAEFVRDVFNYNSITGKLTWKIRLSNKCMIGSEVGHIDKDGYRVVGIQRRRYYVQRIIWLWVTGEWPEREIDHEDMNRANNIWTNLRVATTSQNQYNCLAHKHNTSGFKGVSYNKNAGRYEARIRLVGRLIHLGLFDTAEDAAVAYVEAAKRIAGPFFRI